MRLDLVRRAEVTAQTMERFRDRPFDWSTGNSCLHLAAWHLRALGHCGLPATPHIRSLLGAKRALRARGWANVQDMLAGVGLLEIPPAAMVVGDLAVLEDDSGLGAICICVGGKLMGWHEDAVGLTNLQPHSFLGAFRG